VDKRYMLVGVRNCSAVTEGKEIEENSRWTSLDTYGSCFGECD